MKSAGALEGGAGGKSPRKRQRLKRYRSPSRNVDNRNYRLPIITDDYRSDYSRGALEGGAGGTRPRKIERFKRYRSPWCVLSALQP